MGKDGDGISEPGVGTGEQLERDVDWTRLAAGTVAGERQKLDGLQKWTVGGIFRKLRVAGSEERMWKPSWRIRFEFRKARIVGGDEGAGVGVMGGGLMA